MHWLPPFGFNTPFQQLILPLAIYDGQVDSTNSLSFDGELYGVKEKLVIVIDQCDASVMKRIHSERYPADFITLGRDKLRSNHADVSSNRASKVLIRRIDRFTAAPASASIAPVAKSEFSDV